ncbi:MAG: lipocalin-like domain-containing protein [Steroidobacteraceae bacterium]|nr:lipocalin-like domain-containing protein [Steroidobacteraceae bacterium]MDW8257996.1 lipocalin-like domain-containing protein [Gammaproteobacteria bacterium]
MSELTAEQLCGAWTLLEWRIEYDDGREPTYPFGRDALGLLVYDRSGWMSATMSRRRRTPLSAPSAMAATAASRAQALHEYFAYTARWHIEGGRIVHRIETSLNPILIGTLQVRDPSLDGATLELRAHESTAPNDERAQRRCHVIAWRKQS